MEREQELGRSGALRRFEEKGCGLSLPPGQSPPLGRVGQGSVRPSRCKLMGRDAWPRQEGWLTGLMELVLELFSLN